MKFTSAAIATCLVATPALADLTAEQVLADQLNLLTFGGHADASTTATIPGPSGLKVEGYVIRIDDGDEDPVEIHLGGVQLHEPGDGTVHIIYPNAFPITVRTADPDADLEEMTVTVLFDGMSHTVSGDPDDIRHAISFRRMEFSDLTMVPDTDLPENLDTEFSLTDTAAIIQLSDRSPLRRDGSLDIGSLILRMALTDPPTDGEFSDLTELDAQIELSNLRSQFGYAETTIPEYTLDLSFDHFLWKQLMSGGDLDRMDIAMTAQNFALAFDVAMSFEDLEDDFIGALASGQGLSVQTSYDSMSMDMAVDAPDGAFRSVSEAGQTTADLAFDRTGFKMAMESFDNSAVIDIPADPFIPFSNLSYQVAYNMLDFDLPLQPGDAPQPFKLKFALSGVEMAEDIWSLFDPTGLLPRDPAEFSLDIEGTTVIETDPFEQTNNDVPFRNTKALLKDLRISLAGTELTATGDAEDFSTGDEFAGNATLNARLTGINTLLDTLVGMGLLPEDQAMGARMMIGMVARQTEGEDTLTSTIEVNQDGSVIANGQRIR